MKLWNRSSWFTFVELIVVITILVILASIWFISYTAYLWDARNTKRVSNLNNVYDLFQLFKTSWNPPLPDKYVQISFSWEVLAYQWYLSKSILKEVGIKEYLWKDPKYWDYYTYYVTKDFKYFQFMWYMEEEAYNAPLVEKTYAKLPNYWNPILIWDSLWIITDKGTNQPIQDFYAWWTLDFATDVGSYIINVNDSNKLEWSNNDLGKKIKYLSKNGVLWLNTWSLDSSCMLTWTYVKNWDSILAYSEESILWDAVYNCSDRQLSRVCNDWVLSWSDTYQYLSCTKWTPDNCTASWSYVYNTHTYSLPFLNHLQSVNNINSSYITDATWTFYYTISTISCNDWIFNITENPTRTVDSCNSWYYQSWSNCLAYVNGACTWLPSWAWYYGSWTTYTLVNAPNLTTLNAVTAWYQASPTVNTCQYKCQNWYYWSSPNCLAQWSWTISSWFIFKNTSWVTTYPTSCMNLLTNPIFKVWTNPWNWTTFSNWVYYIDTDWAWAQAAFKVYCDMISDWWWWTMISAQFESDPVTNWNEWIQADYDPILSTSKSFALATSYIPLHNQIWLGRWDDATFVDYVNWKYITWNIPVTSMKSPKTWFFYQAHRNTALFYNFHNPEETTQNVAARNNTLTFDKFWVRWYTWAFTPNHTSSIARWYSLNWVWYETTTETYAWTIWVRDTSWLFLVWNNWWYQWNDWTYGVSCNAYRTSPNYASEWNGIYWIDPDWAWAIVPFLTYCDMTTNWWWRTLTMKIKSSASVLWYDSTYWTTNTTLNPTDLTTSVDADSKYQTFYTVTWNTIRLCINNSWLKCIDKTYAWKVSDYLALANSTQIWYTHTATAAQPNADTFRTTLWFTVQWQIYCNWNVTHSYLRIWVVTNNNSSEWCATNDYLRWFWWKNTYNWLTIWAWYLDSWSVNQPKQWYIWIK